MSTRIKYTSELLGKVQIVPDFLSSSADLVYRDEGVKATLALLKILAIGNQDVAAGRLKPTNEVIARLRAKRKPR
ncbi:MAG: hypothetical protein ACO1PN_16705 [Betaproteobacteria bacterium]